MMPVPVTINRKRYAGLMQVSRLLSIGARYAAATRPNTVRGTD